MPRFTSMPDLSSRAVRRAMMVCASMDISQIGNEVVNDRTGCQNVGRGDDADRNDMLGTNDDGFGSHRHHRIEIASRQRIAQITEVIGKKSLQQRKVRTQRGLEQITLAVYFYAFLAVLDRCADTRLCQDAAEPITAGTDSLDERALRDEVHLTPTPHHLPR